MDIFIDRSLTVSTVVTVTPIQEESYSGNKVYIPDTFLFSESSNLIATTVARLKPAPIAGWLAGG